LKLARLRETALSKVWFVRDYVELMFEAAGYTRSLQLCVWPVVYVSGEGDGGFNPFSG
jgi:hypothetical protein